MSYNKNKRCRGVPRFGQIVIITKVKDVEKNKISSKNFKQVPFSTCIRFKTSSVQKYMKRENWYPSIIIIWNFTDPKLKQFFFSISFTPCSFRGRQVFLVIIIILTNENYIRTLNITYWSDFYFKSLRSSSAIIFLFIQFQFSTCQVFYDLIVNRTRYIQMYLHVNMVLLWQIKTYLEK